MAQDIANEGDLPYGQVRTHLRSILEKLQVVTWLDAVMLSNEFGWSAPEPDA